MKQTLLLLLLLSTLGALSAQDLSNFGLLAHYPLTGSSAADATGNYGDMELTNTSFQGDEGVYVNGVYIGSGDPNASLVSTPPIDFPDTNKIAFSLEFKAGDTGFRPIFVAGDFYRWLGVFIVSGELQLLSSDALYPTGQNVQGGQWYNLALTYEQGTSKIWLDGQLIFTHNSGPLNYHLDISGDRKISNTHGGYGNAFQGNLRNIKIYSGTTVAADEERLPPAKLKIAPNPASNIVQIELPDGVRTLHNPFYIHLMDPNGRSFPVSPIIKDGLISMDISALPPGIYFLYLNDNKKVWVGKVLRQ